MVTGAVCIGVAFIGLAMDTVAGIVDSAAIAALTSPISAVDAADKILRFVQISCGKKSGAQPPHPC
jgi:hypothetical protein